ncbi:MAG: histidine kinase [Treponema sp.]|nr:histidine kinase [Treponema sp.]
MLTETMPWGLEFYIRLVWLFVIVITILLLILSCLFLAMRRSIERESKSRVFSHLVIEGMETERRRISRELHDNIIPQVYGLEVCDQIRSICMELMPPDFSRLSLKDSLANLCEEFSKRTDIECAYSIDQDLVFTSINTENQLHIYRIVQEAFMNIEKHSKAQKAALVARRNKRDSLDYIVICVSDDGVGMTSTTEGLGMKSIKQRAAIIGAKLDFISESSNGLMVALEIYTGNPNKETDVD